MRKAILLFHIFLTINISSMAQNLDWAISMGGGGQDVGRSMAIDTAGNIYVTGYFGETVDFDPGAGVDSFTSWGFNDAFIQKLNPEGELLWVKSMSGPDWDRGVSITLDESGNVYATGYFGDTVDFDPNADSSYLSAVGDWDIFVQKLDENGNFLWAKSMGGLGRETSQSIEVDAQGNVYTTGQFEETVDFDPNEDTLSYTATEQDIFIQKLDSDGNLIWAKTMGGPDDDLAFSIAVDEQRNVYTTGWFEETVDFDPNAGVSNLTAVGNRDIYIQKLDADGNLLWAKSIGGSSANEFGRSIAVDASGNVYTAGLFEGTVDFDPNAGVTNLVSEGSSDIFFLKLDASGNLIWAKRIGGSGIDVANFLSLDASGNVYLTGQFQGMVDFDPNAGTSNLTATGSRDIYVLKLDSTGNLLWANSMNGTNEAAGRCVLVGKNGSIYLTGVFEGTVNFDLGVGTLELSSEGNNDIFVLKFNGGDNVAIDNFQKENIRLYPNPSNGLVQIEFPSGIFRAEINVFDQLGKVVSQHALTHSQQELDLSHLSTGMYSINLSLNSGEVFYGKLVIW